MNWHRPTPATALLRVTMTFLFCFILYFYTSCHSTAERYGSCACQQKHKLLSGHLSFPVISLTGSGCLQCFAVLSLEGCLSPASLNSKSFFCYSVSCLALSDVSCHTHWHTQLNLPLLPKCHLHSYSICSLSTWNKLFIQNIIHIFICPTHAGCADQLQNALLTPVCHFWLKKSYTLHDT